jgi:hypothetical protein
MSGDRDPRYSALRDMRDGEGDELLGLGWQGTIGKHSFLEIVKALLHGACHSETLPF